MLYHLHYRCACLFVCAFASSCREELELAGAAEEKLRAVTDESKVWMCYYVIATACAPFQVDWFIKGTLTAGVRVHAVRNLIIFWRTHTFGTDPETFFTVIHETEMCDFHRLSFDWSSSGRAFTPASGTQDGDTMVDEVVVVELCFVLFRQIEQTTVQTAQWERRMHV